MSEGSEKRAAKPHAAMSQFVREDGEIQINGVSLSRLAQRVGQTPFYVYDRSLLSRRVEELRAAMPQGLSLHYAMKANPMPALVCHMARLVDGLDVASGRELRVALDSGTDPAEISFAGPGKSDSELSMAIASEVTLNIESAGELERAALIADDLGLPARVAIRVNPDFELRASGMKMAGGAQQFGVDAELVPDLLNRVHELGLTFRGFHIFAGSQNLKEEAILSCHDGIFGLARRLTEAAGQPIELLNIGGGLGIPYFPGEERLPLARISERLEQHMTEFAKFSPQTEVVMELGRYLVGEAGLYVCRVRDKKHSRGQTFLVTDGGLHHHLAASGNFGQVLRKNYPVQIGNRADDSDELVNVVGPLCTPLDLLAAKARVGHADVGDLVVVFQSGAYGYSASPRDFLSHPQPVEVLV